MFTVDLRYVFMCLVVTRKDSLENEIFEKSITQRNGVRARWQGCFIPTWEVLMGRLHTHSHRAA